MHDREKAVQNKDKALRLNRDWSVGAAQARYSDDGHWYATLERFPAALFDPNGYVLFPDEAAYRAAPMSIGKQISVPRPGISAMPLYVRVTDSSTSERANTLVPSYATEFDIEGTRTEVRYFARHRSRRRLRVAAFERACGVCLVCGKDFSKVLDGRGIRVLQVHHRRQLSSRQVPAVTTIEDLAVVCANCHMLLHLNPEEALSVEVLRDMLVRDSARDEASLGTAVRNER